jgi:hypothetical protein
MIHDFRPAQGTQCYTPMDKILRAVGLRGEHLHIASLGSVFVCIGLWIRAKTVDQSERGHAENRALFVGLWPLTLWLLGEQLAEETGSSSRPVAAECTSSRRYLGGTRRFAT